MLSRVQSTTQTETSILTHTFALCLHIDNYATDTELLAADLNMAVAKYDLSCPGPFLRTERDVLYRVNQLFRTLGKFLSVKKSLRVTAHLSTGCKIEKLRPNDLKRLGLPDSNGENKMAVLKVPLQFPKASGRRK
jgi:DNA-directed RNA polymerase I subunit RPA49